MQKLGDYLRQIPGFSLDDVFVCSQYDDDMQRKIHRFKFVYNDVDRVYFTSLFAYLYAEKPVTYDVIVYPAVSLKDRILRGPNHAKKLASYFPNPDKKPIICPFQKNIFAGHQSRRKKIDRKNIQQEYSFVQKYISSVAGKRVVLVDDLITTGYTAHTLALLLKKAGAISVVGYFLASEKV